ncbi:carbohydrate ABC transporter membrane protein 1, CUT1 family [Austwickia chelonae]|nr:sugar ABC transporter permease [Austwickia chelonae]SEW37883.1 carbohydrate ABC transporter membrane protein 1, CUT1 family [Austwickia chelonae]
MVSPRLIRRARPWLLLAPALFVLAVLMVWPLVRVVDLSFQEHGLRELNRGTTRYIGWRNYTEILGDGYLWRTVLPNTVVFAAVCVVLTVVLGTVVALFLKSLPTGLRYVLCSAIMVAWAVPAITGTYVWVFLFDPGDGLATHLLGGLGLVETGQVNWFLDRTSFFAIATLNVVHHGFPFVAVTVLAGLLAVPDELYEAARIDGAGSWRQFRHVTLPMLRPLFAVVTILSTIWDFKVFTQIFLMPGGGGTNREVFNLGVWSYITSFGQGRYGMGAAVAVLLTLLLLAVTLVYLRTLFAEEEW